MYLQHFGLSDRPFRIVPSPRYFFVSETHDEGRARILYGIRENRGFVVITGGVGLGKTTVLLSVINELEEDLDVAVIVNPVDSFVQLLRMICEELGVSVDSDDEYTLLAHLDTILLDSYAKGRGCVLLLDEAQNLSIEVLEKVRTLSNLQTEEASLLQIVLVGQPELTAKLNDHRIRQLRQRIGVWHEIRALDRDDAADYIWHRLALSGAPDPRAIIEKRSADAIHAYSKGIPRLINQIADTALVICYGKGKRHVDRTHIDEAARELRLDDEDAVVTVNTLNPRPRVRDRRRWLIAVAVTIVFGVLTGAGLTRLVSTVITTLSSEGVDMVSDPANAAESPTMGGEPTVERGVKLIPGPDPLYPELIEAYRIAEQNRNLGIVYAVLVESCRSMEEAETFVSDLLIERPAWTQPLYVEKSLDSPAGYRVTAGAFTDRSEGVEHARMLKSELGLTYAKLAELKPGARALLPAWHRASEDGADE
jgi:type II secretory pathway predicted ATPase ExeA